LDNECAKCCLEFSDTTVDYTFESKINGTRSTIDHCVVSESLFGLIQKYDVTHSGDDLSDHSPVQLELLLAVIYTTKDKSSYMPNKLKWDTATSNNLDDYRNRLDFHLSQINIPCGVMQCSKTLCHVHGADITQFHDSIVSACINASKESIPSDKATSRASISGWNEYVREHKDR
jgi:hypothetical protein